MPTVLEMLDMSDRVAIVTGGGTHLGRAMASALAELGASIYIASRRAELCKETAEELRGHGLDVIGLGCDVTDEGQVDALVDRVMADRGRVDVMVANAGGAVTDSYIPDASIDEFQRTVDLNLTGTYICAQSAARVMIPERCGAIVTLGSIHGFLTSDKRMYEDLPTFKRSGPPYQAAKGGVINLTRGLAAELGEYGITVNCISPGQIPRATTDEGHVERSRQAIPLQRTGVSDDLKGAIALLASPAGAWITGHNLIVDGGWSIW
ncbi:MAG TPA: SDR family oxidoreductase [Dehalococcoidia bacterium]|jgi:gluconate 5-dehydrogenase|nr:gluconate 5-dehydrogenase [Chloroflexota bacterium]MDP5877608.1 SDR family oxidoreductase [Dehalococcoidia bacterium]MDP6273183.1 SDR family oxidoreductase [Dehalococcoidia bacterium]MDP7159711.1 SDR family oxidoreductase [Dehalococcoidia bacterium]MDP7212829.1 SDR family oxidoreductase [Dehalococcoidia bacterium]|tara:strand:+ start:1878 stop:2672 length:795 start_codon:yes stop_codon:yes gene_type:complete